VVGEAAGPSTPTIEPVNLTPNEVLIIALVALVVLGPQRLPEAARKIGQGYRELKRMSTSVRAEIDAAVKEPVDAVKGSVDEVTSSFRRAMEEDAGDGEDPDAPQLPNSAYRPADELPASDDERA
jgi:Tat protein translocase TatB subunit